MAYIKLDRDIIYNDIFADNEVLAAYIKLMLLAKFRDCVENGTVLKRGQLKISLRKFAAECNFSYPRTRGIFSALEDAHLIKISGSTSGSIITLFNYDCNGNFGADHAHLGAHEKRTEERTESAPTLLFNKNKAFRSKEARAANENFSDADTRAELVQIYGEKNVAEYEKRFDSWKKKNANTHVSCFDCIGKWMNQDGVRPISADAISGGEGDENFGHSPGFAIEKALGIYD